MTTEIETVDADARAAAAIIDADPAAHPTRGVTGDLSVPESESVCAVMSQC